MRRGELTGATGPDGWAIYDPDTDTAHLVNESARAIWELCDGATTPEEMASAIAELTSVGMDQARGDVEATLDRLLTLRLIS
jgi:hypothetical protein